MKTMKTELTHYWRHYALLALIVGFIIEAVLWQPISYVIAAFYFAVWLVLSRTEKRYCNIHFEPTVTKIGILRLGSIFYIDLYKIYRVDSEYMHDHASSFMMILLKGHFLEYTTVSNKKLKSGDILHHNILTDVTIVSRAYSQGDILFRKATYFHKLETMRNQIAICLCVSFKKDRDWGYIVPDDGWVSHKKLDVTIKCE